MRTVTNYFLANLAIADFCVGVFCVLPVMYYQLWYYWPLGDVLCRVYVFMSGASYTASILILMTVSVERFLAVNYPMKVKQIITPRRLHVATVIIWGVAVVNNVPKTLMFGLVDYGGLYLCLIDPSFNVNAYDAVNFCLWYVVPLAIISGLYTKIGITLWRSSTTARGCCAALVPRRWRSVDSAVYYAPPSALRAHHTVELDAALRGKPGATTTPTTSSNHMTTRAEKRQINMPTTGYNSVSRPSATMSSSASAVPPYCCCSVSNLSDESLDRTKLPVSQPTGSTQGLSSWDATLVLRMRRNDADPANSVNMKRRRVIRLLVAIILAFALSVLPYHVYVLHIIMKPPARYSDAENYYYALLRPIVFLLLYSNSAINPALYAFMSNNFRASAREAFRRRDAAGASRCASYPVNATYRSVSYAMTAHQV
ncbi:PREDICTED: muscarinic acetylcholine receptor M4-like [Priapulus caudatus]|uniref:Muscarinic acetylcholine receptor M4-like n=1 Tax=Priapulus caudatus TaxID=37621 RepID=A0ABM1EKK0_PRICU|nr:PREDICTED: muscarinic acetylcholine receptor M4-like [Priapulus caudatus]